MKYARSEAKAWTRANLRGHITCTTTPLKDNGDLDEQGLKHNIEHMLSMPGIGGLYVGSVYQEFWTLTSDERKRITEIITDTNAGRLPVVVGTSHTCARDVVDLARHAQSCGADLVMVWPPYYGPRTPAGVHAFYEYVAERIDTGICTYSTTMSELGYYLTPDHVAKLAEIDLICAVKESAFTISAYTALMDRVGHILPVSCPQDEFHLYGSMMYGPDIMPHFLLGTSRPLYMQTRERPHFANFFQAVEKGDFVTAKIHLKSILAIAQRLLSKYLAKGEHNIGLTKYMTSLFGMAAGPVRAPLVPASDEQKREAVAVLKQAKLLP